MRKRPLCFLSIILVLIMWILQTSGDGFLSSDVVCPKESTVAIYGKVYQCEYKENQQILYLKRAVLSVNSQKQKLHNVRITCRKETPECQVSDSVCAKGILKELKEAANPGQFDVGTYYHAKKISYTMWEPDIQLLNRPDLSLTRILFKIRQMLAMQYEQILPNQYGALLKGITLGDKSDLSEETEAMFQIGGISHILAISALHLQILGNSFYRFLRKCRVPLGISAFGAGSFLICYGMLTGASVATLRALIMFLLSIGAEVTGRTYDRMTGMALAAVILVAGNPAYLSYSGFWLSFFAVCSFMIFREKRKLAGGILLYLFMAPVMLNYFYEISLYSVFINLFVVPTIGAVLVSGLAGCVSCLCSLSLGRILVFPAAVLLHIYKILCEINEMLPAHMLVFGKPTWVQMLVYYGIMGAILYVFRKNRIRKIRFAALGLMIPAWMILTYRGIQGIQITMLDVGQGDSMVVRTESGNAYLIDGGSTSEEMVGKYRILPYLKYSGVNEIEAVFVTHADADHMNGIQELLEMTVNGKSGIAIEKIVLPNWQDMSAFEEIYRLAEICKIEIYQLDKGGTVTDGQMQIGCIHPNGERYQENLNEGSFVLRLDYREFSMLFTGDLEGKAEVLLAGKYGDVDILKVAHHGSRNSTGETFLEEVQPEICLISCGENNRYRHPHEELLERLNAIGAKVFQTAKHGALIIRSDGEKIDLKTYKQYNES